MGGALAALKGASNKLLENFNSAKLKYVLKRANALTQCAFVHFALFKSACVHFTVFIVFFV